MDTTDVIIIGGGVIGCSIAYQLRRRGVEVVVLDQGEIGAGASCAATGLLAPIRPYLKRDNLYMSLQLAALGLFSSLVPELEEASGISIEYQKTGTLRVVDLQQEERLRSWIADWCRGGSRMELLIAEDLHQREPSLAPGIEAALYNPDEPQLNALKLVASYRRAASNAGATFLSHQQVSGIVCQGERVNAITTVQGDIACSHLVVAAGAWSALCCDWLNVVLPVRPLRGQSLSFSPVVPLHHILFGEHIYLAPKMDGSIIVGATQEDVGFDASTTPEGIASLMSAAARIVPSLAESTPTRTWAGLRPRTPDTRPVIGLAPGWQNAIIACGHGGFGMLLSSITGQAVAELITSGQIPPIVQPFALQRFSPEHHAA